MKKYLLFLGNYIFHFLVSASCYFNLPVFCAYLIKISLFKPKFFKKKLKSKKIFIVFYREIGIRDVEIIYKSENCNFDFLFLRRSITKTIFFCFCNKKKFFFDYLNPPSNIQDYFTQNSNNKKNHEKFCTEVISNLKKYYNNKTINFITFNFDYFAEAAIYVGCKKNNIGVKLWHKEGIQTDTDGEYRMNTIFPKLSHMFEHFTDISVYNERTKERFIRLNKTNFKKVSVNGCPRITDFITNKKYYKKPRNILFLPFDIRRGIPKIKQNKNLSFKLSLNKVIKILNELSDNKDLNIIVKYKHNSADEINNQINKKIKIFKTGSAERLINQADIIIGHNSVATIEALANGKYVMVPFFEKNLKLRKYLLNFEKDIVYTSEVEMKKKILSLINKRVVFPLNNKKYNNTIQYYLGNPKNITKRYIKFLNN
jgi:hypothetical protein